MRWLFVILVLWPSAAFAHSGVHERIDEASAEIVKSPKDASLYLERAQLFIEHADFDRARRDIDTARGLDADLELTDLVEGLCALEGGEPERAIAPLTRFLAREPTHLRALELRARALVAVGRREQAVADLDAAIASNKAPPRLFVERATLLENLGQLDRAVQGLSEGVERLGPLVVIVERAVEIEEGRKQPLEALKWITRLPKPLRDAPVWLVRAAELSRDAGQPEQARAALSQARTRIRDLPKSRREAPAMRELNARIEAELARIDGPRKSAAE